METMKNNTTQFIIDQVNTMITCADRIEKMINNNKSLTLEEKVTLSEFIISVKTLLKFTTGDVLLDKGYSEISKSIWSK